MGADQLTGQPGSDTTAPTAPVVSGTPDVAGGAALPARQVLRGASRWLLPLLLALVVATVASSWGNSRSPHMADKMIAIGGALVFLMLSLAATLTFANQLRHIAEPRLGRAHAMVLRLVVVLSGGFTTLLLTLGLLSVPIGQLILGGALTGVVFGIAGQQTLSNLFAGIVLLLARPFQVGDHIRLRSGALGGIVDGLVTEIGLAYLKLDAPEGFLSIPNSQALGAIVGPRPPDPDHVDP
jgi:small-conductance mechanosensitive channel